MPDPYVKLHLNNDVAAGFQATAPRPHPDPRAFLAPGSGYTVACARKPRRSVHVLLVALAICFLRLASLLVAICFLSETTAGLHRRRL